MDKRTVMEVLIHNLMTGTKRYNMEKDSKVKLEDREGGAKLIIKNNPWKKFSKVFIYDDGIKIIYKVPDIKKIRIDEDKLYDLREVITETIQT